MDGYRRRKRGIFSRFKKVPVRSLYLWLFCLVAVVVVSGAIYGGYSLLRDFRAQQMAAGSREQLAQGKVREALLRAQSALMLSPEGPGAWRSMAAVMDAIDNPLAIGCYEKIIALGAATSEDRQNYLQAALKLGQVAAAREQASELEKSGDAGFARLVAADEMLKRGNAAAAEVELRGVPGGSAVSRSSKLMLAQLLVAQKSGENKAEALSVLRELSGGDDTQAAAALAAGLTAKLLPPAEHKEWLNKLENHPAADDRAFLAAKTLRIEADPASRGLAVDAVMERFSPLPVERKTAAAVWLNQLGEYDRALRLVSSQDALANPDAFVAWLDTLAGKGDWARVDSALAGERIPLRGASLEMFRARAARMVGNEGAARQGYQQSVNTALRGDPRQVAAVMAFLEAEGQMPLLRESLFAALGEPATSAGARQALLAMEKRSRDASKMREMANKLRDALPDDNDMKSMMIYYDTVLGGRGLTSEAWQMCEAEPENFIRRSVYALAVLKEGYPEKAVRVFDGLSVRSDQISPEQKAIVVSVLAANGRMDQAQAMAATLDRAALTEQEVAMLEGYLQSGKDGQTARESAP